MRICYLCFDNGIPYDGTKGASVHLREMSRSFSELGHLVMVLAYANADVEPWPNLQFVRLADDEFLTSAVAGIKKAELSLTFRADRDFCQLASHLTHQAHIMKLLLRYQPDILYERYSLFGWSGIVLARELGIPLILEINAPLSKEAALWRGLGLTRVASDIEARVFSQADACFVVSDALRSYAIQVGARHDRVVVLPNGVNADRFSPGVSGQSVRQTLEISADRFVIGYVGGFKPWHDVITLITAFGLFSEQTDKAHLLLVGQGPELAEAQERVHALGLDRRVTFTGEMTHSQVPEHIAAMDLATVLLKSAENSYFSPLKMFEYMAMGKCVVASRIGQLAELIIHRSSGWLCAPEDPSDLATAFRELYEDPAQRHVLGLRARDTIVSGHTWHHNAQRIVEVVESLKG